MISSRFHLTWPDPSASAACLAVTLPDAMLSMPTLCLRVLGVVKEVSELRTATRAAAAAVGDDDVCVGPPFELRFARNSDASGGAIPSAALRADSLLSLQGW